MKPQLAKHLYKELELKSPKCIDKTYMITEKLDGWYGYIDLDGTTTPRIMSRQGRPIPSLKRRSLALCHAMPLVEGRLIFEVTIPSIPDFHAMNGVLNRSKGNCEAKDVLLYCHDFIPTHTPTMQACDRYLRAERLVDNALVGWLKLVPLLAVGDVTDAQNCAETIWEKGGEGVILKQHDSTYAEGKRNSTLLKIKEDVDADLFVIGLCEGEGKYTNTTGALICESADGVRHKISGMTDLERNTWWKHPTQIVGQVIEIKAMQKLKDGTYREPRYKGIRFDKTESDID